MGDFDESTKQLEGADDLGLGLTEFRGDDAELAHEPGEDLAVGRDSRDVLVGNPDGAVEPIGLSRDGCSETGEAVEDAARGVGLIRQCRVEFGDRLTQCRSVDTVQPWGALFEYIGQLVRGPGALTWNRLGAERSRTGWRERQIVAADGGQQPHLGGRVIADRLVGVDREPDPDMVVGKFYGTNSTDGDAGDPHLVAGLQATGVTEFGDVPVLGAGNQLDQADDRDDDRANRETRQAPAEFAASLGMIGADSVRDESHLHTTRC